MEISAHTVASLAFTVASLERTEASLACILASLACTVPPARMYAAELLKKYVHSPIRFCKDLHGERTGRIFDTLPISLYILHYNLQYFSATYLYIVEH